MDNTSDFECCTQAPWTGLVRVPTQLVLHQPTKPPVIWPVDIPVNPGPQSHRRLPTRRRLAFNAPWAAVNPPNPTPVPNPPANPPALNHVAAANSALNPVAVTNPPTNSNQVAAANPTPSTLASGPDGNELDGDEEDEEDVNME